MRRKLKKNAHDDIDTHAFMMEQFRTIQTTIQFTTKMQGKQAQIIAVTSANKGEGKSFCALRLAKGFAESGHKVLLIDADIYNPSLTRELKIRPNIGFTNCLVTGLDPAKLWQPTKNKKLTFLPSGALPSNAKNIYQSDRIPDLLANLRVEFDIVIIDTPPTLLLNDSRLIGDFCDGTVLVVNRGKTKLTEFQKAVTLLELANNTIIGAIINRKKYSRKELENYRYY